MCVGSTQTRGIKGGRTVLESVLNGTRQPIVEHVKHFFDSIHFATIGLRT
jgi:hypothetical protein